MPGPTCISGMVATKAGAASWAWLQYLPFVAVVNGKGKLDMQGLIQGLLQAAVIGGIVLYGSVQVLGEKTDLLKRDIQEIKMDVKQMQRDLYQPVRK